MRLQTTITLLNDENRKLQEMVSDEIDILKPIYFKLYYNATDKFRGRDAAELLGEIAILEKILLKLRK
jgi:hypothetical protein